MLARAEHPPTNFRADDTRSRNGPLWSLKIRAVCAPCNNGWMNRLETAARPHLTRMMLGLPTPLNADEQRAVAHWLAVKTVVAENRDRSLAVTPADDRHAVMCGAIPAYFTIYVGQHDGNPVGYYRSAHTVAKSPKWPSAEQVANVGASKNIQSTTFTVGAMFAHINASTAPGISVEDLVVAIGVYDKMRLWPVSSDVFNWPQGRVIPADTLHAVARSLNNATATVGRWA